MSDNSETTNKLFLPDPLPLTTIQLKPSQANGDKLSQQWTNDANSSQQNSPTHQKFINNKDFQSRYSSILKDQLGNNNFKRIKSENQNNSLSNTVHKPYILTLRALPRKSYKQSSITVMLKTEYPIIYNLVYKYFKFKFYNKEDHHHDIFLIWMDTYVSEQFVKRLKSYQRINHFPSSCELGRKDLLSTNIKIAKQLMPEQYQFYPNTWILPKQHDSFYSQMSKDKYYIVKPHANCQGRGIYLCKNPNINRKEQVIVQEYIPNPMLIQECKFDLRIYVLLRSLEPLRIYVYKEGLCRLATSKYVVPDDNNVKNQKMHLTNYAINKLAPSFVGNKSVAEESQGHKRSYTSALKYLQTKGFDTKKIEERIQSIIIRTIMAGYTKMSQSYKKSRQFSASFKQNREASTFKQDNHLKNGCFNSQQPSVCFQLFGFDIMLLETGEPILLEINHQPSLVTDSPFDLAVKKCLIMDTINLLSMDEQDKSNWQKCVNEGVIYRSKYIQFAQLQNMGGYKRVYPINLQKSDSLQRQRLQRCKLLYESILNKFLGKQLKGINKIKISNYKTISYRPGTRQNNSSKQIVPASIDKQQKIPNSSDKTRANRSITSDQSQKAVALTFYNLFSDSKYHVKRGAMLMPQDEKQENQEEKSDRSIKKHLFFAQLISQRQKHCMLSKKNNKFERSVGYENFQNQYRQRLQINTLNKLGEKKVINQQKGLQNIVMLESNDKFKQCLFSTKNRGIMHYINSQRKKRKIEKDNGEQNIKKSINKGSLQKRGNHSQSKYQSQRFQSLDLNDMNQTAVGEKNIAKMARELSAEEKIEEYRHIYGKSIREKMQRINNIKIMKNQIKKFNFNNFLTKSNKIKFYNKQETQSLGKDISPLKS